MPELIIDLQTILWLTYSINALLSLFLACSGRKFRGAWLFVIAQTLMALGTISDSLPASVPSWFPLILGNSCYAASSLLYIHSVWVFRYESPFPRWLYGIIPVQILSYVAVSGGSYFINTMVFSTWSSIGPLSAAILLLWRVEPKLRAATYLTASPFLVLGLASLSRLIILGFAAQNGTVLAVSDLNVWYTGGAILLSTIMLFGYFMMTALRNFKDIGQKDEEIEARNQQLMEAARVKDLFFAIVAHDLRAPIGGAARYVRKHLFGKMSGLEAKYHEVETLAASLEKTNDFLEKLLWWSRAQLVDWSPASSEVNLDLCFAEAIVLVENNAHLKNIKIIISPGVFPLVIADEESLKLILSNLLSNSIKFSRPDQEIRLLVKSDATNCIISVEDDGIGMDEDTLSRLFRIESKLSTMGTMNERGSGMGLILSKSLIERNNGSIELTSKVGVGTTATIKLPLSRPAKSNRTK